MKGLIVELAGASKSQLVFSKPDRLVYPVKDASFEKAKQDLGWESKISQIEMNFRKNSPASQLKGRTEAMYPEMKN